MLKANITYQIPKPTNLTKKAIAEIAKKVANKVDFKYGLESDWYDVKNVIEKLGGKINYTDDWDRYFEQPLIVNENKDFQIYLARWAGPYHDRFNLTKYLGNYILHSEFGEIPTIFHNDNEERIRWEANWFAEAFLTPLELFKEKMTEFKNDKMRLAAHFQVNVDFIENRMENLNF